MKTSEEKNRQKQLLSELRRKEKEDFLNSLPMSIQHFRELFDNLDEQLEQGGCDHTLALTEVFLTERNLDKEKVKVWLGENGGYCDCEVLYNVEERFENL